MCAAKSQLFQRVNECRRTSHEPCPSRPSSYPIEFERLLFGSHLACLWTSERVQIDECIIVRRSFYLHLPAVTRVVANDMKGRRCFAVWRLRSADPLERTCLKLTGQICMGQEAYLHAGAPSRWLRGRGGA